MFTKFQHRWTRFWMRHAGLSRRGRISTWFATWFAPPYKARHYLAFLNPRGYVSPSASIHHTQLRLGKNCFIGDRVIIFRTKDGGSVELGNRSSLFGDNLLETGDGGSIVLGEESHLNPGVQLVAYKAPIQIGRRVGFAANCAVYSYNHGIAPGRHYAEQLLEAKGPIVIEDEVWVGTGVIILSGVRIGKGAVIGAGAVVTKDVPEGAIAVGVPARVVKMRSDFDGKPTPVSSRVTT